MSAMTDSYETYARAAIRATYLARVFDTPVQVKPEPDGWLVQLPANYSYLLDLEGRPIKDVGMLMEIDVDDDDDEGSPAFYDDDSEDLRSEFAADQEDWARSDEDGWFYPDE